VKRPALRLVEVGPRDGLQTAGAAIATDAKVAYVDLLSLSGLREIETGAFVSPKAVPEMADSEQVFARIARRPGVLYSALVPNEKGLERAIAAKAGKISVFTAASETFNKKNIGVSIQDSIERFKPVVAGAKAAGLPLRAYVSTAFFCPFEGKISPEAAVDVVRRLEGLGIDEHSIGDTIGRASPDDVRRLLELLLKTVSVEKVFLHFHDTYGMAVANALIAWEEYGVSGFDASTGGVGGCPYAPGATGNVAMEDLVFAFHASGGVTKVDVKALQAAAKILAGAMGRPVSSRISKIALYFLPFHAPVVKWISQQPPKLRVQVRFLTGAPLSDETEPADRRGSNAGAGENGEPRPTVKAAASQMSMFCSYETVACGLVPGFVSGERLLNRNCHWHKN
jgi:hydroxymethylglutaryl-CoA lyase